MTFRQLRTELDRLSEEQLANTVTVYVEANGDFWGVLSDELAVSGPEDPAEGILDWHHPYIVISDC